MANQNRWPKWVSFKNVIIILGILGVGSGSGAIGYNQKETKTVNIKNIDVNEFLETVFEWNKKQDLLNKERNAYIHNRIDQTQDEQRTSKKDITHSLSRIERKVNQNHKLLEEREYENNDLANK